MNLTATATALPKLVAKTRKNSVEILSTNETKVNKKTPNLLLKKIF